MSQQCSQGWVAILGALLTPTIALAGAYIAWQQWKTNQNKLRLELFGRRYAFYEAARDLIGTITASGRASDESTFQFLSKTKGARFIVGAELAYYLKEELYRKATSLNALDAELEGQPAGEARSRIVQQQRELKDWFRAQYDVLDRRFEPFLKLKH
ncbi:MAG: hypothetical protein U1F14_08650 [Steroidobacteraceae bacterium]